MQLVARETATDIVARKRFKKTLNVIMPVKTTKRPKYYTPNEVSIHNTLKDLWVSFLGKVYDLTPLCEKNAGKLYACTCKLSACKLTLSLNVLFFLGIRRHTLFIIHSFNVLFKLVYATLKKTVHLLKSKNDVFRRITSQIYHNLS